MVADRMKQKTTSGKWIIAGALFLLFSFVTVQNAIRYRVSDIKRSFVSKTSYKNAPNEALELDFTQKGLQLLEYKGLNLTLPSDKLNGYSILFDLEINNFQAIFFKFTGPNASVDFSLDAKTLRVLPKNDFYSLTFEKNRSRIDFMVNGQKIGSVSHNDESFAQFAIVNLDSAFFIRSVKMEGPGDRQLYHFDFVPKITSAGVKFSLALLFALFWALLAFADFQIGRKDQASPIKSAGRVLFFFTPVWGGSLFPFSISTVTAFLFFSIVSIVSLVGNWCFSTSTVFNKRMPLAVLVLSIIGLVISLRSQYLLAIQGLILLWGVVAVLWAAWSIAKTEKKNIYWGLGKIAYALFPVAAWVIALLPPWLNHCSAISSAMVFSSGIMLSALVFRRRAKLAHYTLLLLFLIFTTIGAAELIARTSSIIQPNIEIRTGEYKVHGYEFLDFLQTGSERFNAEMRKRPPSKLFRSGTTMQKPSRNTTRVMVLGGSSAFGYGIKNNENTFSGVLEKCLNRSITKVNVEVINAGMGGYNLFMLNRIFESSVMNYEPGIVILYINSLDSPESLGPFTFHEIWNMNENTRGRIIKAWERADDKKVVKPLKEKSPPYWILLAQKTFRNFSLYNILTDKVSNWRKKEVVLPLSESLGALKEINPPEDYRSNLRQFIDLCKANGIKILFVNEFDPWNTVKENPKRKIIERIMADEAAIAGIKYFNLQEKMQKKKDTFSLFFQKPPYLLHPNEKGHEVIGNELCDYVLKNDLL